MGFDVGQIDWASTNPSFLGVFAMGMLPVPKRVAQREDTTKQLELRP